MLTCKQVSNALAKDDYMKLPPHKRAMLRMHVGLCFICGEYNKTVMWFYDSLRDFREREETLLESEPGLSETQKASMNKRLHQTKNNNMDPS